MKKVIKYVLMGLGGLVVLGIIGAIFGGKDKNKETAKTEQKETTNSTTTEPQKSEPQNWAYSEDVDKMTSEKKFFAA